MKFLVALLAVLPPLAGCGSSSSPDEEVPVPVERACVATEGTEPDFLREIGCRKDFDALASEPLDASIPGARSVKVVLDLDDGQLYFQNSKKYKIHYAFASMHLSGMGKRTVPGLAQFNQTEYFSPNRRFLLGAVTWYEGPAVWAFEVAPYDTASASLIAQAHRAVAAKAYFGPALFFHPTSETVAVTAKKLPSGVRVKSTSQLYEKVQYQPLNLAESIGRVRFVQAASLEMGEYLSFRDIVVLDHVPNDLSVTMGIVTAEFQTPLSHINVLSQTRKIPNMAVRNAFSDAKLRSFEGKWVRFTVRATDYTMEEVTLADADAWWEAHKPKPVQISPMDTSVKAIVDVKNLVDRAKPLGEGLKTAVRAFGGKGTHYGAMAAAGIVPMPRPDGFVIPVHFYVQFLEQNGFDKKIDLILADEGFRSNPTIRDGMLKRLRDEMEVAPVDPDFERMLTAKLNTEYPNTPMRYRSSSTAEDLDGFAGAGLYTSKTGDPANPLKPHLLAVKKVWASVWRFRGYEERAYRSVDQKAVGMAILVHPSFPEEEASGVAMTANPFDPSGVQPGYFVNVQPGDESVTLPKAGVRADQFVVHFETPGQPVVYIEHSSLVASGKTVLSRGQVLELGAALKNIHDFFRPAYGTDPSAWYALEVDFKFDAPAGQEPKLFIKQARPHPGRGR